jgi:hypothetical protein
VLFTAENRVIIILTSSDPDPVRLTYRKEGELDLRKLSGMIGISLTAVTILLIVGLTFGMVGASLGVGIGQFSSDFGTLRTEDGGSIYPMLGTVSECQNAPQLAANLHGNVSIKGNFGFFKTIPVPGEVENVRVDIVAADMGEREEFAAENVSIVFSSIDADSLKLSGNDGTKVDILEMYANGSEGPEGSYATEMNRRVDENEDLKGVSEFGINVPDGGTMEIDTGAAVAHNVAFEGISPPDIDVSVTVDGDRRLFNSTGISESAGLEGKDCEDIAQGPEPGKQPDPVQKLGYP